MEFEKIEDIEKIRELKNHCRFIDDELDTDVYVLSDEDNTKTIFVLKRIGDYMQPISTVRQLDVETLTEAQGKGYATRGFELMLKAITEREDISEVHMDAANPFSGRIAERYGIPNTELGRYTIQNKKELESF